MTKSMLLLTKAVVMVLESVGAGPYGSCRPPLTPGENVAIRPSGRHDVFISGSLLMTDTFH